MKKALNVLSISICILLFVCAEGCGKTETLYYNAAWAYLENGDYEEAIENFKLSTDEEDDSKDALRGLGIAYVYNEQFSEAVDPFIEALNKSNGHISSVDYDINYYLGYAYEMSGQYEEAVDTYSALITLRPKESENYYRRAICYLELSKIEEASADFETVTSMVDDDYDLHIRIYFSILNAGFEEEADSYLTALLDDADRKISDYDRGRMEYYLKDYSEARVYLEKAKDYSKPDTILMLGKTYEAIEDYKYAASLYAEYLDTEGNDASIYNQLGMCRLKIEDYEGAASAFELGLKLEDAECEKELLFNDAVAYEYMHDYETALQKFTEYLEKYPKDENALHEYDFLYTRVNKLADDTEETSETTGE